MPDTLLSLEDALRQAVQGAPDDPLPRLVLADWLDEHDQDAEAGYQRWRARRPGLVHGDIPGSDNGFDHCVYLDIARLPHALLESLPCPLIHKDNGPESSATCTDRILLNLWLNRETCERDLLAAWSQVDLTRRRVSGETPDLFSGAQQEDALG